MLGVLHHCAHNLWTLCNLFGRQPCQNTCPSQKNSVLPFLRCPYVAIKLKWSIIYFRRYSLSKKLGIWLVDSSDYNLLRSFRYYFLGYFICIKKIIWSKHLSRRYCWSKILKLDWLRSTNSSFLVFLLICKKLKWSFT